MSVFGKSWPEPTRKALSVFLGNVIVSTSHNLSGCIAISIMLAS